MVLSNTPNHVQWHHMGGLKSVEVFIPWKSTNQAPHPRTSCHLPASTPLPKARAGGRAEETAERQWRHTHAHLPLPNQYKCGYVSFRYWPSTWAFVENIRSYKMYKVPFCPFIFPFMHPLIYWCLTSTMWTGNNLLDVNHGISQFRPGPRKVEIKQN